jgi:hypothetical protein
MGIRNSFPQKHDALSILGQTFLKILNEEQYEFPGNSHGFHVFMHYQSHFGLICNQTTNFKTISKHPHPKISQIRDMTCYVPTSHMASRMRDIPQFQNP